MLENRLAVCVVLSVLTPDILVLGSNGKEFIGKGGVDICLSTPSINRSGEITALSDDGYTGNSKKLESISFWS